MHNSIFSLSNIDKFSSFFTPASNCSPYFRISLPFILLIRKILHSSRGKNAFHIFSLPPTKQKRKKNQTESKKCVYAMFGGCTSKTMMITDSQQRPRRSKKDPNKTRILEAAKIEWAKQNRNHSSGGGRVEKDSALLFLVLLNGNRRLAGGQRQMRLVYDTFRAASPHHLGVVLCLEFSPIFCLVAFINFCEQEIKMLVLWVRWMAGVWQWFGLKKKS